LTGRADKAWRVLDTGILRAAENMAMDRAILEAHQAGKSPHTLRFLRFKPTALVGFHQDVDQELRRDVCAEQDIDIQRRITGGGALYFDPTQLGWELFLDKRVLGTADMSAISKRICEAAAAGISRLGVDARYRPRNDIEVDGRKISGTGGAFDGDSIMFQGTLLIDFDVERMLRVLRIPAEKLSNKAIASARERVANLKELLGELPDFEVVKAAITTAFAEEFNVEFAEAADLNEAEQALYEEALAEIDSDEWIYQHNRPVETAPQLDGVYKAAGGLMRVSVLLDTERQKLKQVWITGDFFVNPRRMVVDLESALRDTPLDKLEERVNAFFDEYPAEMLLLQRDDFIQAIRTAVGVADDAQHAAGKQA
jgi:lipoate-protein ligase A